MQFGLLLADAPRDRTGRGHLDLILRQLESGQGAGFTYFSLGQHFLYGGISWPQPVPMLARLAAEIDDHVTLGTGVMLAPFYHPVLLAEEIATLDVVCNGRFVLGLGTGYRQLEFDAFEVPFGERVGRLEESIELLRLLWTQESVTHRGRFWRLDDVEPHLYPVQPGGPPIWVGAKSRAAVRRAARLGDAWLVTSKVPFDEIRVRWGQYVTERQRLSLPVGPQPAQRQIVLAATRDEAMARHEAITSGRLDAYEARELDITETGPYQETRDATRTAFLGPPDQVIEDITAFVRDVPCDPIIIRCAWPTLTDDEIVAFVEELGREVVQPLRDLDVVVD